LLISFIATDSEVRMIVRPGNTGLPVRLGEVRGRSYEQIIYAIYRYVCRDRRSSGDLPRALIPIEQDPIVVWRVNLDRGREVDIDPGYPCRVTFEGWPGSPVP
jgi:hypothetical protein